MSQLSKDQAKKIYEQFRSAPATEFRSKKALHHYQTEFSAKTEWQTAAEEDRTFFLQLPYFLARAARGCSEDLFTESLTAGNSRP